MAAFAPEGLTFSLRGAETASEACWWSVPLEAIVRPQVRAKITKSHFFRTPENHLSTSSEVTFDRRNSLML